MASANDDDYVIAARRASIDRKRSVAALTQQTIVKNGLQSLINKTVRVKLVSKEDETDVWEGLFRVTRVVDGRLVGHCKQEEAAWNGPVPSILQEDFDPSAILEIIGDE